MGFALHLLHLAILVLGACGVAAMLRPTLSRGRTVASLRRAAMRGTLADTALRRALLTDRLPVARSRRAVQALHAYSVAAAALAVAVPAEWAVGVQVSAWALVALLPVLATAAGAYLRRPRRPEHVVVAAVVGEWLVHAVLVATGAGDAAASRVLDAVLLCHPVGTNAPRVTVLGYAVRSTAGGPVSASGLLAIASACLATACVAAWCNREVTRAAWRRVQPGMAAARRVPVAA